MYRFIEEDESVSDGKFCFPLLLNFHVILVIACKEIVSVICGNIIGETVYSACVNVVAAFFERYIERSHYRGGTVERGRRTRG